MWHALGEAVAPLKLSTVAATVFTNPELASVGATEEDVRSGKVDARIVNLPLDTNPRAKMNNSKDGFVKLICRQHTGIVLGGVIVGPRASELILGVSIAVQQRLTVDEIAHTFAVYPSLSGSVTEAARSLMQASPEPPAPRGERTRRRAPAGMAGALLRCARRARCSGGGAVAPGPQKSKPPKSMSPPKSPKSSPPPTSPPPMSPPMSPAPIMPAPIIDPIMEPIIMPENMPIIMLIPK